MRTLARIDTGDGATPLYAVGPALRPVRPRACLCLAAGIHGDEPAGVEAVVRLLEGGGLPVDVDWLALPALNPAGLARGTRTNPDGIDLNRAFDLEDPPPEVAAARGAVRDRRFDLFVCCHEDDEAGGWAPPCWRPRLPWSR